MRAFNPSRYERAFDVRLVLSGTVGRFSLETAFITQEKEFIVVKTYHAVKQKGKYERFVSQSLWFGAKKTKNGLHTFVNSLVDRGRQVGKCLCNLQQNMLFLIKSNSKCLS